MPSDRETAARALAEAMGWHFDSESGWFDGPHPTIRGADTSLVRIPAADAPLPDQLRFVGRLAVAVGAESFYIRSSAAGCIVQWVEPREIEAGGAAPDLVLAGMLAAAEAARSKR